MTITFKSQLIDTVLRVIKIHDDNEHQKLLDEIDEIQNMGFATEIDRKCHLEDVLFDNETFMHALLMIAMSGPWKFDNGHEH